MGFEGSFLGNVLKCIAEPATNTFDIHVCVPTDIAGIRSSFPSSEGNSSDAGNRMSCEHCLIQQAHEVVAILIMPDIGECEEDGPEELCPR